MLTHPNRPLTQMIIRAHRYGPAYGIPLSTLCRQSMPSWSQKRWIGKSEAVIFQNRLLLKVELVRPQKHVQSRVYPWEPKDWEFGLPHCTHSASPSDDSSSDWSTWPNSPRTIHTEREGSNALSRKVQAISERASTPIDTVTVVWPGEIAYVTRPVCERYSCPDCPTEWKIDLVEKRGQTYVRVTRYTDLGNGINPRTSPEWQALVGDTSHYHRCTQSDVEGCYEDAQHQAARRRKMSQQVPSTDQTHARRLFSKIASPARELHRRLQTLFSSPAERPLRPTE